MAPLDERVQPKDDALEIILRAGSIQGACRGPQKTGFSAKFLGCMGFSKLTGETESVWGLLPVRPASDRGMESDAAPAPPLPIECFYEKVVKVKGDVAAIPKFSVPMPQIELDITTRPRWHPSGGCARRISAGVL
jgi:hypothetical protein